MKKRILVTGAGGFIGSHLTEALVNDGWSVRAVVHYNSRGSIGWLKNLDPETLSSVEIMRGDIQDNTFVSIATKGCQVAINLAALIGIPYSYHAPGQYVMTNVFGALNIFQAARQHELELVIQTSTSEVYGTAQIVPIKENHQLVGQSPYAATKIAADQLALSFHRSFGTPVSIIRPFNTYGPRQSKRAVIPTIITQLIAGQREVSLGSLSPTRDFNFVEDTVRAFVAMANSKTTIGEVVNIGSGFEISVRDTLNIISDVLGIEVTTQTDTQRLRPADSEVERLLADNSKAAQLLGWKPKFGGRDGFRLGIEKTVDWFQANHLELEPEIYAI